MSISSIFFFWQNKIKSVEIKKNWSFDTRMTSIKTCEFMTCVQEDVNLFFFFFFFFFSLCVYNIRKTTTLLPHWYIIYKTRKWLICNLKRSNLFLIAKEVFNFTNGGDTPKNLWSILIEIIVCLTTISHLMNGHYFISLFCFVFVFVHIIEIQTSGNDL